MVAKRVGAPQFDDTHTTDTQLILNLPTADRHLNWSRHGAVRIMQTKGSDRGAAWVPFRVMHQHPSNPAQR